MDKAGIAEAKANLQPSFYVRDIDARCPRGQCPLAKNDKEDTFREPRDESCKYKTKSQISSSANQPQNQTLKKDKRGCQGGYRGHGGYLATEVNATEVAKKDKDKAPKDLSHIKYYTCHEKGHYANKYPNKPKN